MTFLVTGATGNVGRLVVDHLIAAGAPVRALTKNPKKAALPEGVEVVKGYLGEIDTLPPAFKGIEEMYLAPLADTVKEVVALAKESGVRRIVALSQNAADQEAEGPEEGWYFYAVEKAVEDAGLDFTFLRPGQFFINALSWADQIRETNSVRTPYPNASYTAIDLDDIAAVAARVLLDGSRHNGKKYMLTGPQSLTKADQVATLAQVLGREITLVEQSRDEALQEMVEGGFGEVAEWMLDLDAVVTAEPEKVLPTVEEIIGRPGHTFADWAARNVDAFR